MTLEAATPPEPDGAPAVPLNRLTGRDSAHSSEVRVEPSESVFAALTTLGELPGVLEATFLEANYSARPPILGYFSGLI